MTCTRMHVCAVSMPQCVWAATSVLHAVHRYYYVVQCTCACGARAGLRLVPRHLDAHLEGAHRVHVGHDQRYARPLAPRVLELERALQLNLVVHAHV